MDFMSWLEKEAKGYNVIAIVIGAVILDFILTVVVIYAMEVINFNISNTPTRFSVTETENSIKILSLYLPCLLYVSAAMEECIFRCMPLVPAVEICGTSKMVLLVAVVSSIMFGVIHGGYDHIFLQGVGGFIYCIVFLKCGGFNENYTKGFLSSTTSHFLFNMTLMLIAVIAEGNQYFSFS